MAYCYGMLIQCVIVMRHKIYAATIEVGNFISHYASRSLCLSAAYRRFEFEPSGILDQLGRRVIEKIRVQF